MNKLNEIADYAEDHDFAAEMEQGTWEANTDADPMITTSVRLPKSLLDWIRQRAAARTVRPSALIRQPIPSNETRTVRRLQTSWHERAPRIRPVLLRQEKSKLS